MKNCCALLGSSAMHHRPHGTEPRRPGQAPAGVHIMFKKIIIVGSALAFGSMGPAPAMATIMTAIYSGTISSGTSLYGGLFGLVDDTELAGLGYVVTYTYDTSQVIGHSTIATTDEISGYGLAKPISAILKINNVEFSFLGSEYSVARTERAVSIYHESGDYKSTNDEIINSYIFNTGNTLSARSSLTDNLPKMSIVDEGYFQIYQDNITNLGNLVPISVFAIFHSPTNFVVISGGSGSTGTIPEPAIWAMMISGFGMIGVMMRRRLEEATACKPLA